MIDTYTNNPFIPSVKIKEKKTLKKLANSKNKIIDEEGNQIEEVTLVYAKETISDNSYFIKIYSNLDYLNNMSKIAIKLFTYVIKNLKQEQDTIIINVKYFSIESGYKNLGEIYKGIKELIDLNIIAKSDVQSIYWINPNKIYNGNRNKLIKRK